MTDYEDIGVEAIQNEIHREKKMEKEWRLLMIWGNFMKPNVHTTGVPKGGGSVQKFIWCINS